MTLAQLLTRDKPAAPTFQHAADLPFYNLKNLANSRFSNFRKAKLTGNFMLYAGGPGDNDDDTKAYIEGVFQGAHYIDKNHNNQYDDGFDDLLSDIKLFVSHDGAYLMKEHKKLTIADNEIAIFLEVPGDDIFSDNVMLIKAGKNAAKYAAEVLRATWTKERYTLEEAQIKSLISSISTGQSFFDQVIAVITSIENTIENKVTDIAVDVMGAISNFFTETIRIDEKRWNAGHADYTLDAIEADVTGFIKARISEIDAFLGSKSVPGWAKGIIALPSEIGHSLISAIEGAKLSVENNWAFICGCWNGAMDLVGGIFALLELVFKGIGAHNQYKQNEAYYKALTTEYLDNFAQALLKLDWVAVIANLIVRQMELQHYLAIELPGKLIDSIIAMDHTEISYYKGYIAINIVEFLLPPLKLAKLAKAAKVSKLAAIAGKGPAIAKVERVTERFEHIGNTATKTERAVEKKDAEIAEHFFETVEKGIDDVSTGGTEKVKHLTDEISGMVKKEIDELLGASQKAGDDVAELAKIYGRLIKKGNKIIKKEVDDEIRRILREAEVAALARKADKAYRKYIKSKAGSKNVFSLSAYIKNYIRLFRSRKIGVLAEETVHKYLGGKVHPKKAIKLGPRRRRFPDNFHKGTMREIKAGRITMKYKKQIDKDIQILVENLQFQGERVANLEWHAIGGIDEAVIKYIQKQARDNKVLSRIKIVIY